MNAVEEKKEYKLALPRVYSGVNGDDMIIMINGQIYGEIQEVHYDEKTSDGYIDFAVVDRDISKMFVEPGDQNEVDVYINGDFAKLKLEIDGVRFGGTSMNLNIGNCSFTRRQYFTFATTLFDTYEEKDTPWYKPSLE